jgi:hypothetical protein
VNFLGRPFFALFLALCALLLPPPLLSLGRRDKPDTSPSVQPAETPVPFVTGPGGEIIRHGDRVEVSGRVRLVGSDPFPDLVITGGDDQDWYLEGPDRQAVRSFEQRELRVRGRVELREQVLANGRSLGFRRFLRDVEILD